MGFRGGALVAGPLSRQLLSFYDSRYDPDVATSVASGGALVSLFLTLGIGYFVIMMFRPVRPYQVGAIHGRLPTAWSAAGVAGPLIINRFLDAEGKPGTLTAEAYRPALFTMVGVLAIRFVG
jgi:hypothetical protein